MRNLDRLNVCAVIVSAIAAFFIALATIQSTSISSKLEKISSESFSSQKAALQAELRPYLTIQLHPGEKEYLKIANNGQLYIDKLHNDIFMVLPISWANIGKIPALNVEVEYSGPVQNNVRIISADDSDNIIAGGRSGINRAWINVAGIKDNKDISEFETVLQVRYQGNEEIDSRIYISRLKLNFKKRIVNENAVFILTKSKIEFGYDSTLKNNLKKGDIMNNINTSITLWPIMTIILFLVFRKPIQNTLNQISEFSFGSFSIKLKNRLKVSGDKYREIQALTARDLKFFLAIASQSWEMDSVKWKLSIEDNLVLHEKLESAGLVSIKNKNTAISEKNVDSKLTALGEELYSELTSLISEFIK